MSIQTGPGPFRVDPDDLQFTHLGKTIVVKLRDFGWPIIVAAQRMQDGSWQGSPDLAADTFGTDAPGGVDPVAHWIAHYGGPKEFLQKVVMSNLNAWLETVFPATGAPATILEQLQAAISAIKFTAQPDGTLLASVV